MPPQVMLSPILAYCKSLCKDMKSQLFLAWLLWLQWREELFIRLLTSADCLILPRHKVDHRSCTNKTSYVTVNYVCCASGEKGKKLQVFSRHSISAKLQHMSLIKPCPNVQYTVKGPNLMEGLIIWKGFVLLCPKCIHCFKALKRNTFEQVPEMYFASLKLRLSDTKTSAKTEASDQWQRSLRLPLLLQKNLDQSLQQIQTFLNGQKRFQRLSTDDTLSKKFQAY